MNSIKEKDLNNAGKLDSGLYVETINKKGINMTNTTIAPKIFNFNSNAVRTIDRDGQIWFVATDVCAALGYKNTSDAIATHLDDDERSSEQLDRSQMGSKAVVINESGLYALVLRSRKPEARKFAKWVTSEVLPAIRKTGEYRAPYVTNPNDSLSAAQAEQLRLALKEQCDKLPKDKQGAFMTKGWSKLKSHFGCTYRDIPQKEFTEAVSIVSRHVAEWELLDAIIPDPTSTTDQMLSLLTGGRWLLSVQRGNLVLNPVPKNAFVVSPEEFPMVIRETLGMPAKVLSEVIGVCASRLQYIHATPP